MPAYKSQHFVPQFYLRNFGHGDSRRLISLYNRRTAQYVEHASIKTQACDDYFYEQGGTIEAALHEMEAKVGPIITEMIRTEQPPKWDSPEHKMLLRFVVFQLSRTPFAKEEANEQNEKMVAKIDKLFPGEFPNLVEREAGPYETIQMLLSIANVNFHAALDLRYKLLRNTTKLPFITSDHPVALYNQFHEKLDSNVSHSGLNSRGLQIFFPLSSKYLLVIFDANVYKVGGRNFRVTCVPVTEEDVITLGILQVVNAGEHIYFDETVSRKYVVSLVSKASKYLKAEKSVVRSGPAIVDGRPHGTIVHASRVDTKIGLNLRCMKVSPSAKKYETCSNPQLLYRNIPLLTALPEFLQAIRTGHYTDSQFEEFWEARERRFRDEPRP